MCILLKLHYAKFDVTRLFCLKVIEFGGSARPPFFGKERDPKKAVKCAETTYDLLNKYPEKNLIYVEPVIYEDAYEKRANALKGWQRIIAVKNQGMI